MDHNKLHDLMDESAEITPSALMDAMKYPYEYAEAERILEARNWYYDISCDAWRRTVGFV